MAEAASALTMANSPKRERLRQIIAERSFQYSAEKKFRLTWAR